MVLRSRRATSRVSVVIPTYNRKAYVALAIESVLAQTYTDCEVIVVDDGSTDGTGDDLSRYHSLINYVRQPNQGESKARNVGIARASGEYIAFLDDDDLWLPRKLKRQVQILDAHPEYAVASVQGVVIDKDGAVTSARPAYPMESTREVELAKVLLRSPVGPTNSLFRREVFSAVGAFDPGIQYGEDWDLALRTVARHRIIFLNEPLVCIRVQQERQNNFWLHVDRAERRFNDHMTIIDRVQLHGASASLKQSAIAREYAELGICEMANRKEDAGCERLLTACHLDPDTWLHGGELDGLSLVCADTVAHARSWREGEQLLRRLYGILVPYRGKDSYRKMYDALAQLNLGLAFDCSKLRDGRRVRRAVLRAIWFNHGLVRNRGLISICLASFLGVESLAALRRHSTHSC